MRPTLAGLRHDHWAKPAHVKNLRNVLQRCRQTGIGVALSNPCFDLWLLLHFCDFPEDAQLTCSEVGKQVRSAVGSFNKTRVYNLPIDDDKVANAVSRSKAHFDSNKEIPKEPQTAVHLIIEDLVRRRIISIFHNEQ